MKFKNLFLLICAITFAFFALVACSCGKKGCGCNKDQEETPVVDPTGDPENPNTDPAGDPENPNGDPDPDPTGDPEGPIDDGVEREISEQRWEEILDEEFNNYTIVATGESSFTLELDLPYNLQHYKETDSEDEEFYITQINGKYFRLDKEGEQFYLYEIEDEDDVFLDYLGELLEMCRENGTELGDFDETKKCYTIEVEGQYFDLYFEEGYLAKVVVFEDAEELATMELRLVGTTDIVLPDYSSLSYVFTQFSSNACATVEIHEGSKEISFYLDYDLVYNYEEGEMEAFDCQIELSDRQYYWRLLSEEDIEELGLESDLEAGFYVIYEDDESEEEGMIYINIEEDIDKLPLDLMELFVNEYLQIVFVPKGDYYDYEDFVKHEDPVFPSYRLLENDQLVCEVMVDEDYLFITNFYLLDIVEGELHTFEVNYTAK